MESEFFSVFKPQDTLIKEFEHWVILLRSEQITLGDCIFVLKRNIPSFGDMTKEEGAEVAEAIQWYEKRCTELFGAVKFNYIAAMMRDNFVHFHAFPRYSASVDLFDRTWEDERWPRVIQFSPTPIVDGNLHQLVNYLKE